MEIPSSLREYYPDEVIEIMYAIWGSSAGNDLYYELGLVLTDMGWARAEGVPCLWYFDSAHGRTRLITIVDDMLFSEPKPSQRKITAAALAALRKRFGDVTSEEEPTSFVGFKVTRDRPRRQLTLSMPEKAKEIVNIYAPHLLAEGAAAKHVVTRDSYKRFEAAADSMALPTEHGNTPTQKRLRQRSAPQVAESKCMPKSLWPCTACRA